MLGLTSVKPFTPRVQFGTDSTTLDRLSKLRDELVAQFPGGPLKYSNGSGIGSVTVGGPDDRPTVQVAGIHVYHETQKDRDKVIQALIQDNVITRGRDGVYRYKKAPVEFQVIGTIRPF